MRFVFSSALLCAASLSVSAYAALPTTSSLGVGELPVRDTAMFQFSPTALTILRADDSGVIAIPVSKAADAYGGTTLTFTVPDGKFIVLGSIGMPVLTPPITMWIVQLAGSSEDEGEWLIYDAFGNGDGTKNPNFKDSLSTPLVLAPGKTYQLHSSNAQIGVSARGFYLDETE